MLAGKEAADDALLARLQRKAFDYFLQNVNSRNGLIAETPHHGSPASSAMVGFALSAYPLGIERGWLECSGAAARTMERSAPH